MGKEVCVTGISGFIASWLVKLLLDGGYAVKATVRDLGDPTKVAHLKALEGAEERLQLYEADLLEEGSFDSVVDGCHGVFHTASAVPINPSVSQTELIEPAVEGTINVLKSCKKASTIKRVVVTSSMPAVMYNGNPLRHVDVVDETWFSDPIFCEENKRRQCGNLQKRVAWTPLHYIQASPLQLTPSCSLDDHQRSIGESLCLVGSVTYVFEALRHIDPQFPILLSSSI